MKTPPETMRSAIASMALATALLHAAMAGAQPHVAPNPPLPEFGQSVTIELTNAPWPTYLPATRYTRSGSTIDIDFEYAPDGFGPISPSSGPDSVVLGVLVPGTYQVRVRLEFDYRADASYLDPAPPRTATFGSVRIPDLAPGTYRLEGWGRSSINADYENFFVREFSVASTVPVIEYYSALLDHYFIAAGSDEVDLLDRGQGDWKRTGQRFSAWARAADAPAGASPVCRFYAFGPNSHFFTSSSDECASLRALEQRQRAEASALGEPFLGWGYEGTAFWAGVASGGQCPSGMAPVYRAYNNRAEQMDSNHRFMAAAAQRDAMAFGWLGEGTHLCTAR